MNDNTEYEVKLEIFEGPLDLLIHLIRKNEVDIFDIPIAIITEQYLEYLDMLKALNINVAGDFLVMASTLVHIKSKMLLPGYDEDEEAEDPRDEITGPLLEYLQLKEIAGELSEREILGRDVFKRNISLDYRNQFQGDDTTLEVNLFQLMDAFKKIIEQNLPGTPITFRAQKWSLKERIAFIINRLKEKQTIYFTDLFEGNRDISEFVVTFLALLEVIHVGLVKVFQPEPYKDIRLEAYFTDTEDIDYDKIIETHR
ncbi:MAG: segregation/condensation protein A [Deltaproteobacteria bacterium]|nr:segregation/condensation protein A [Deltaproteobacteria bacterium]